MAIAAVACVARFCIRRLVISEHLAAWVFCWGGVVAVEIGYGRGRQPLMYGTNSGPTRLDLKQFNMLRRSLSKMVMGVSKGEPA